MPCFTATRRACSDHPDDNVIRIAQAGMVSLGRYGGRTGEAIGKVFQPLLLGVRVAVWPVLGSVVECFAMKADMVTTAAANRRGAVTAVWAPMVAALVLSAFVLVFALTGFLGAISAEGSLHRGGDALALGPSPSATTSPHHGGAQARGEAPCHHNRHKGEAAQQSHSGRPVAAVAPRNPSVPAPGGSCCQDEDDLSAQRFLARHAFVLKTRSGAARLRDALAGAAPRIVHAQGDTVRGQGARANPGAVGPPQQTDGSFSYASREFVHTVRLLT